MYCDEIEIENCPLFYNEYRFKIFLLGMRIITEKRFIYYDFFLKSHGLYYDLQINIETESKLANSKLRIIDDFDLFKLQKNVIILNENLTKPILKPVFYLTYNNNQNIRFNFDKTTNGFSIDCKCFYINFVEDKVNVELYAMPENKLTRDEFIEFIFDDKEDAKEHIKFLESNDEYQLKSYINLVGGRF